jgi:hypothetical protein
MNGGGIVISNNSDGRGMMLPEREGSFTFNKLPFISMSYPKKEVGLNPSEHKIIINSRKIKPHVRKEFLKVRRGKIYPLEHYRKIKTSQQFWKKNENPYFKKFNKKREDEKTWIEEAEKYQIKGNNVFQEMVEGKTLNYSDIEYIKSKKLLSAPKTPQKLVAPPIFNNPNNNTLTATKEEKPEINENMCTIQPEKRDVKVCLDEVVDKKKEIIEDKKDEINIDNKINKEEMKKENDKEKEKEKDEEEKKEIKDPLLEEELEDKENIEDVISYLNGLDYDKYCKDMEIREALTLLKHKMDKEKEEQKIADEKAQNKVTIEGFDKQEEKDKEKKEEENKDKDNKNLLPDISNKIPEQNKVEIVDEEELKRKEEIKKYKIAEQIAKTEQMKKVHSVNSIKKLLEREGLDKLQDQPPLKITVIKENPLANYDECQTNKLPFLHSLPLV